MIPQCNETAGEWWGNTKAVEARLDAARASGYSAKFDLATYFLHDVPEAVLRDGPSEQRPQAELISCSRSLRALAFDTDPRRRIGERPLLPLEFQRNVARDRLKLDVDVLPGGHLVALSNPQGLADQLLRFAS